MVTAFGVVCAFAALSVVCALRRAWTISAVWGGWGECAASPQARTRVSVPCHASHTAAFGHRQPITDNAEGRQRAEGADNARAAAQL